MVLLIAGPGLRTALRLITWPFRSEMRLFLILSVVSLLICILELMFYPDLNADDILDQADLPSVAANLTAHDDPDADDVGLSSSMLEIKSVFIPCVFSLFSLIFVLGKLIQFIFFGSLSETERSNLSRLLFRFTVFRVIILSGAINVSRLSSVFGWLVWFGALGLIHACALTATSRCNQLAASSLVTRREWFRLSCALTFLLVSNWYLLKGGLYNCFLLADINVAEDGGGELATGRSLHGAFKTPTALGVLKSKLTGRRELIYDAVDVVAYILAESMLLFCLIVHLIGGFLIQAYDRWLLAHGRSWLQQTTVSYYMDLVHVLVYRFVEIAHYLHLLLWSRIFSVASLIVFLHIRFAYSMLANRIRQHMAHRRLSRYIAEHFELHTTKSLTSEQKGQTEMDCAASKVVVVDEKESLTVPDRSDSSPSSEVSCEVCAICWEPMHTWRRLPCRHNFHEYCLRSWLEQNPTCPTCRRDLGIPTVLLATRNNGGGGVAATAAAGLVGVAGTLPNDQAAMGFWLRNIGRNAEGILNPPTTAEPTTAASPSQVVNTGQAATVASGTQHSARNLFATAVGLNFGVSIGSGSMVAAAAQAVARDAAPGTSRTTTAVRIPSHGGSAGGNQGQLTGDGVSRESGLQVQQSSPTETATMDDGNQVRRRSFHFDGSRYFSWLPSLHVELSDVIREVFAAGADQLTQVVDDLSPHPPPVAPVRPEFGPSTTDSHNPDQFELIRLPASLRQPAQEIARMFPQFALSTIVADLLRTGVPEMTVENLISRPPPTSSQISEVRHRFPGGARTDLTSSSSTATDGSNETMMPIASTSSSDSSQQTVSPTDAVTSAPSETESSEPESLFSIRRRSMLEQARKRFLSRNDS